jgi:peptide deformylase
VIRAETIELTAQDIEGNTVTFRMKGFEARIAQHELDHLDGILFLDRLVSRHADLRER